MRRKGHNSVTKNDTNPPLNYEDARIKGYPRVAIKLNAPTVFDHNHKPLNKADDIIDLAVIRYDEDTHNYQGIDVNSALYTFAKEDVYTGDIVELDELYKVFLEWGKTFEIPDGLVGRPALTLTMSKRGKCYIATNHTDGSETHQNVIVWHSRPQGVFLLQVAIARSKDLL